MFKIYDFIIIGRRQKISLRRLVLLNKKMKLELMAKRFTDQIAPAPLMTILRIMFLVNGMTKKKMKTRKCMDKWLIYHRAIVAKNTLC